MTEVWGQLSKALDNAQTIDEAIDEKIAAHESAATSHLGAGESLEAHKSNEVIDHPALSVVGDKMGGKQDRLDVLLITDFWPTQTGLESWWADYIKITATYGGTNPAILKSRECAGKFAQLLGPNGTVFQFTAASTNYSNIKWLIAAGWVDDYPDNQVIGFYYNGTNLYARWENFGVDDEDILISGIDIQENHVYRVNFDYDTKTLSWYIDGVLKASLVLETIPEWSGTWIYARFEKTVSSAASLFVGAPVLIN